MRVEIDRVASAELTLSTFIQRYYEPEKPVLITSVKSKTEALTPERVKARFQVANRKGFGWHDAPLAEDEADPVRAPELVRNLLSQPDVSLRSLPLRVWLHPRRHRTLLHYDGNGVHGFNLQVHGRKRWTLIDPTTPLRCVPFIFLALAREEAPISTDKHDVYEFETGPGDMLFLPRHWFHRVSSEGEANVNLNWVWASTSAHKATPIGRRESELTALSARFPFLARLRKELEYEPASRSAGLPRKAETASAAGMATRILKELALLPVLPLYARSLLTEVGRFSQNNFNV